MDGKMRRNVLTFVTVALAIQSAIGSYVTFTENSFNDVVVMIEDYDLNNGKSCQEAVEFAKDMIRNTSDSFGSALPDVTKFGNVTIMVPDSWSTNCIGVITNNVVQPWARSRLADFRITQNHPVFSWYPYSFQYYTGCNQPGLPINVPFTFNNGSGDEPGRRLAREWAHYRYGVFDEGGIKGDLIHPSGYMTFEVEKTAKVSRPNVCSHKLAVSGNWNKDGCKDEIDSECEFNPDINGNDKILSSLMYRPDFSEMSLFCDENTHDDGVPSKQNYYCNGLSAKEVIYQHSDFMTSNVGDNNPTGDINFNVISNPFKGYHIILDTSSFDTTTFTDVKRSLVNFITFLPNSMYLSVTIFNSTVNDLLPNYNNQTALDDGMRRAMINAIIDLQLQSDGNAIVGLRLALDQSISRAESGQDVIILTALLSATGLSAQIDLYKEKRVNAHLLDYHQTRSGSDDLAKLTVFGSYRWIPIKTKTVNGTVVGSYAVASGALQSIYSETKTKREKIYEQVANLTVNVPLKSNVETGSFSLDGQASSLYLALNLANGATPSSWTVTPPGRDEIELDNPTTSKPRTMNLWLATINSTIANNAGEWKYTITFSTEEIFVLTEMSVWADAFPSQLLPDPQEAAMVELKTWNSAAADPSQIWDPSAKPMGLYAQITQGRKPVHQVSAYAHVYAYSDSDGYSSLLTSIPLLDDGIADVTSGDGIYSGYLTTISNTSTIYSVRYEIKDEGTAQIDLATYGYPPTTGSSIPLTNPQDVFKTFFRSDYGSSFRLTTSGLNDKIPPQRITDFQVSAYDGTNANLTWTTPRDNFGSGDVITVFRIESSISSGEWIRLPQQITVPIPTKDGESVVVTHTVEVPKDIPTGGYAKYRIVSIDPSGNEATYSNVATVAGLPNPWPSNGVNAALMWGLIGAGIFLLVLILILVGCCCLYPVQAKRKKRAATKKMKNMFSSDKKKKKESSKNNVVASSNVYVAANSNQQPWTSPNIKDIEIHEADDGNYYSDDRHRSHDKQQRSSALTGSQMIYFGDQEAVPTAEDRDGGYSDDRGVEEMIKRAPSMDLQLATILMKNSSNLSIDQIGSDDSHQGKNKPVETMNTTVFARPFSKNEAPSSRNPAHKRYSERPISQSQSESNLYYTDVNLIPPLSRQSGKASPTNSYFSLYADQQRASSNPRNSNGAQMDDPISKLAATMRAGLRGEEWQDSNSFVYSDPRYDADQPKSTFEPHPANRVGLPPPPTQSEMYGNTRSSTHSLNRLQYEEPQEEEEEEEEIVLRRGGSKPSLVSAV